jgi:apolipoprotein N-acyltransferase
MIQPSAPLQFKPEGDESLAQYINNKLLEIIATIEKLTYMAEKKAWDTGKGVDLVVIPEGAFPYVSTRPSEATGTQDTDIIVNVLAVGEIYSSYLHKKILLLTNNLQAPIFLNENDAEFRIDENSGKKIKNYYNISVLYDVNGKRKEDYRKNFLLPFGEYIPFPDIFGFKTWLLENTNASDFAKGNRKNIIPFQYLSKKEKIMSPEWQANLLIDFPGNTVELIQGNRFVSTPEKTAYFIPLICYEVLSGEYVRNFGNYEKVDFIVNVTNDRWFGDDSKESWQHLQLSIFRAIENRKALVRSTNSGISAYIEPTGRIKEKSIIEQAKEDFKILDVVKMREETLYQKWGEWLQKVILLVLLLFIIFHVIKRFRKK